MSKMEEIAKLNFRGKTYQSAFMDSLEMLYEEGLISNSEDFMDLVNKNKDIESELVMLMSIICEFLWDTDTGCVKLLRDNYESVILDKATGIDLEILGEYFGIYRIPATSAMAEVTFQFSPALSNSLTIPKGMRIGTDVEGKGLIYECTDAVVIPQGATEYTCNFTSKTGGTDGRVSTNTLTTMIDSTVFSYCGSYVACYNASASTGGNVAETDDELRDRIKNWAYSIPRTTESSYVSYLRSIDGLKSFKLVPKWNGTGTLKLIILPNNQQMIDSINEYVTSNIASIDDDITVVGAKEKDVDVNIIVNTDIDRVTQMPITEKDDIRARIVEAIQIYVNGGTRQNGKVYDGMGLGEDFIPFECAVFIKEEVTELKNLTFTSPATKPYVNPKDKGHTYAIIDSEVITIEDDEVAVLNNCNVTIETTGGSDE